MSINNPLVSVVVPAYNHEKYIAYTIDSIVKQTYKNIELIVINDGSSDQTADVIRKELDKVSYRFFNVLFIDNKDNQGVVKSLNEALSHVQGEYISFCSSDDTLLLNNLEELVKFLSKNDDYVLAVGDNEIIDGQNIRCYWDIEQKNVYNATDSVYKTFASLLRHNRKDVDFLSTNFGKYQTFLIGNYIPNGFVIRKQVLCDKMGGYPTNCRLEDLGLHLYLSRYGKYKFIDQPLAQYRWHDENTSHKSEKMLKDTIQTLSTQWDYANKKLGFEFLSKLFIKHPLYKDLLYELCRLFPAEAACEIRKYSFMIEDKNMNLEECNSILSKCELDLENYKAEVNSIYNSLGWKLMRPFRILSNVIISKKN
ncbi:glycosyltransferase family 2 protein [Francisella philomiragia]|uniref:glycosyltransferase family 2 protein n=1 Tax=Francisella philomiragia TaxID=28110 RepID=UPI0019043D3C|nr:glycosyltransferase family 2 protein [Francisella philomiragia]MBK2297072.1 glycosyltransferase [Francisella philomiragia]MBK2341318.1 glycosyltransferase [Francisella philomiragia]